MTPHEAFLQAISESPDDDTPRLVYADCLEESRLSALGLIQREVPHRAVQAYREPLQATE
jgi:uncharacterized protein (TIGR02996 family)